MTFISRAWPTLPLVENVNGVRHIRVRGFDHTRFLLLNLLFDSIWGIRVGRKLTGGDALICNTITLPIWIRRIKPLVGKVAVMIGRTPKGQVLFYRGVDRIYAPSTFVERQISPSSALNRTRVIGYPIDWRNLAESARQLGSPVIVGYIGRLHPEKGISLILEAARILTSRNDLPKWRIRIVGPSSIAQGGGGDPWLAETKFKSHETNGDCIEWLDAEFDPARLACLYGSMNVFCYPSLSETGETFGVSVAEAMAAKCAVVVSALGCFQDIVEQDQTGLVFDHRADNAAELLADCIGRLISDETLRNDIAVRGQEHVRRFDFPEVSERILKDLSLLTGEIAQKHQQSDHA